MIMTSLSLFWLPSRTLCGTFRAPIISAALAFAGCSWPPGRPWASATGLRPSKRGGPALFAAVRPGAVERTELLGTTKLVEFGARPAATLQPDETAFLHAIVRKPDHTRPVGGLDRPQVVGGDLHRRDRSVLLPKAGNQPTPEARGVGQQVGTDFVDGVGSSLQRDHHGQRRNVRPVLMGLVGDQSAVVVMTTHGDGGFHVLFTVVGGPRAFGRGFNDHGPYLGVEHHRDCNSRGREGRCGGGYYLCFMHISLPLFTCCVVSVKSCCRRAATAPWHQYVWSCLYAHIASHYLFGDFS